MHGACFCEDLYDPKLALAMKPPSTTPDQTPQPTPTPAKADDSTSTEPKASDAGKESPKNTADVLNQFKEKLAMLTAKGQASTNE